MSTAESGDFNLGQAPAPVPAAEPQLAPLTLSPAAPVEPLAQPAPPVAPVVAAPPPMSVSDMRDVPLGTLIFREGLLTEEQLEEALQDGMQRGKRLGEVLLERGLVSETDLGRLLAGQKGLQFVQLDAAAIDPTAVQLLPVEKARLHSVLPIGFRDGLPVVAVADPSNDLVIENVRRALNCEPHLVVAGREALQRQIEAAYGVAPVAAPEPAPAAPVAPVEPVQPVVAVEPAVPVEQVAPVAPVVEQPVAQPVVQPVVEQPVAPAQGEGLWLGAPEPAAPAPEPQVVQPVVAAPEPVVAAEPVVQPLAEPVSISYTPVEPAVEAPAPVVQAPAPEPVIAVEPALPAPEPVLEAPAPPVEQPAQDEEAETALKCFVLLRLTDGETLDVGAFQSVGDAKDRAKTVVEQISSGDDWPFFNGRFIRPEAIVSVDLVEPEGRWLGSAARRAAWDAKHQPDG